MRLIYASDDVSKIVDENGEPLEVYHHTDNLDLVVVNNLNFIFLSIDKQHHRANE